MTGNGPHFTVKQDTLLGWLIFVAIVVAFLGIVSLWLIAVFHSVEMIRTQLLADHFVTIVGVPTAAISSFILVFLFRQASGEIEFEGLSFKFRGASGPLLLWILCFLAMTAALKFTW